MVVNVSKTPLSSLARKIGKADIVFWSNFCITALLCLIFLCPLLLRNMNRYLQIGIFLIWLASSVLLSFRRKVPWWSMLSIVLCFFWYAILIFYKLAGFSSSSIGNYLMALFSLGALTMGIFVHYCYSEKNKKALFRFLFLIITFVLIDNIILSYRYPNAQVIINTSFGTPFLQMDVAETSFYFATVIAIGLSLVDLTSGPFSNWFLLDISVLVFGLWFLLFVSPRATSLFFCLCYITLFIFLGLHKKGKTILLTILVISGVLSLIFAQPLRTYLSSLVPNRLLTRIIDVLNILRGDSSSSGGSFSERIQLMSVSFSTWTSSFKNFFFGVGDIVDYADPIESGIGGHSEIIDNLAKYGLFGESVYFALFITFGMTLASFCSENKLKRHLRILGIFVVFLLYLFVNSGTKPNICCILSVGLFCLQKKTKRFPVFRIRI